MLLNVFAFGHFVDCLIHSNAHQNTTFGCLENDGARQNNNAIRFEQNDDVGSNGEPSDSSDCNMLVMQSCTISARYDVPETPALAMLIANAHGWANTNAPPVSCFSPPYTLLCVLLPFTWRSKFLKNEQ